VINAVSAGRRPAAASNISPITVRARAAREIVRSLQADIASGRLPLGARLPSERDLARHFAVSQPTVREAIRALDLMGLLDVRHGSGVYVAEDVNAFFSTSLTVLLQVERVGIIEVLDLRALLGGYSARRAATFATEAEIDRMAAFLDAYDAPAPEDGPREMVGAAVSFQLAVSAAARNPLLFAIEGFLIKLISQLQLEAQEHHGRDFWIDRVGSFRRDRRRLLQFVRAHDGDGAVGAMQAYLRTQFAQFSNDPELAAVSADNPGDLIARLDAILPDLRPSC
jgi:GntR family transcriptional repressor for pyruvate dehydrogenase complex